MRRLFFAIISLASAVMTLASFSKKKVNNEALWFIAPIEVRDEGYIPLSEVAYPGAYSIMFFYDEPESGNGPFECGVKSGYVCAGLFYTYDGSGLASTYAGFYATGEYNY